jgi:hypothetical protein
MVSNYNGSIFHCIVKMNEKILDVISAMPCSIFCLNQNNFRRHAVQRNSDLMLLSLGVSSCDLNFSEPSLEWFL